MTHEEFQEKVKTIPDRELAEMAQKALSKLCQEDRKQMTYTDNTPMPFGKHKGTPLANVPDSYLLWIYDQGSNNQSLMNYIKDNIQAIKLGSNLAKSREKFNAR